MELDGLQELRLVIYVFEYIEQEQQIEARAEIRVALMDVVSVERAHAAQVLLQSHLVKFETGDRFSIAVLYFSLQQSIAAADLSRARAIPDHGIGQPLHNLETPANPKMIVSRYVEPPISHVYGHRRGKIGHDATLRIH